MNIQETLFSLTQAVGVSGDEFGASETACNILKKYAPDAYVDDFGNVIGNIGKRCEGKPHVLIDAHIDQIGFIVTYITETGFLKVSGCGGLDRRLFLAQEVTVFGTKVIKGVITSTPPHLEKDNKSAPEIDDIFIDIGMSKEQAEEIICPGDRAIINTDCVRLLGDRVTSKSIDDRSGVASILYALDKIKEKDLPFSVSVLFSSQEETGERGAKTGGYEINPDIAIAVDVSFAFTSEDSEYKCGKLQEGVMIGIAPSLSRELSNKMITLAKNVKIPYQLEVMNGETGTNADAFSISRNGVKAVTLSIPLKYMHTPVEVVSLKDVEITGDLIAEYLLNGGADND